MSTTIENENTNNNEQENQDNVTDKTTEQNKESEKVDYSKLLEDENFKSFFTTTLQQEVEKEVKSLKNKNKELLDEIKPLRSKLENDQYMKLLNDGKHDEVFSKIKEERDSEWKPVLSQKEQELESLKNELKTIKETMTHSKLNDIALKFANETRLNKKSIEDAQEKFRKEFVINDKNEIVHRENKLNTNGKPFSPEDFYAKLESEKPHWFDGVSGSGTTIPSISNGAGSFTPEQIANMSQKQYREAKKKGLIK